jgi:hypothetical protein
MISGFWIYYSENGDIFSFEDDLISVANSLFVAHSMGGLVIKKVYVK